MSNSPRGLPADLHAYEPPVSLWGIVVQNVPGHEQEEMKNVLGESLVEQSLELHQEVETLLEIWREYRENTTEELQRQTSLPEPPDARDRLKQEICFFVRSIREKARENGRSSRPILSRHNSEVLDYAMDKKRPGTSDGSRPSTAHSHQDGRETPRMITTPGCDRLSLASTLSDDVEAMGDKLNMLRLEEVAQHLRETLEEEVSQLLSDINFLQNCLDEEADFRCGSSMAREPTLTELREERAKLEKDLLSSDPLTDAPVRRVSQGLLKPVGGKLRPPSGSMSSSSRPIPLKASHQLTMATQTLTLQSSDDNNNSAASDHISTVQKDRDRQRKARKDLKMDSSDLGYLCSEQPSHVQIRTGKAENSSSANARVVRVGRISKPVVAEDNCSTEEKRLLIPSPPSSAKPAASQRPTSASRFRRMVLHCRDGT